MRIAVFSDSHRMVSRMVAAVEALSPDVILHLGDHIADARQLRARFPGVPVHMVAGNCDLYGGDHGETEQLLELGGCRILMTHGHVYGVKSGLDALIRRGAETGAALALYGHTHAALIKQARGVWLMNPGQMESDSSSRRASCGVVTADNGSFSCEHFWLHRGAGGAIAGGA